MNKMKQKIPHSMFETSAYEFIYHDGRVIIEHLTTRQFNGRSERKNWNEVKEVKLLGKSIDML